MSDTFSASDLEPGDDERHLRRLDAAERVLVVLAVLAVGVVAGGLVALGACAAPFVFRLTPAPFNGQAMGAAFARFDRIALGASVLLLGVEVVRTWMARRERPSLAARARRLAAVVFAGCVTFTATTLTPGIADLHASGARRGEGDAGAQLDEIHRRAELVARIELAAGLVAAILHALSVRTRRLEDGDDAEAPLPGGG